MKTANIGSISHGTLKTEDLLQAFANELEWQIQRNGDYFSKPENFASRDHLNNVHGDCLDLLAWREEREWDEEEEAKASEMVNETLPDILQDFAPPYCYFGSHPGDGADYGFWPDMDSVDELEKFDDFPDELPGDDFAVVNDHGNVTLYGADGRELWAIV